MIDTSVKTDKRFATEVKLTEMGDHTHTHTLTHTHTHTRKHIQVQMYTHVRVHIINVATIINESAPSVPSPDDGKDSVTEHQKLTHGQ